MKDRIIVAAAAAAFFAAAPFAHAKGHGKDPKIRAMAKKILESQKKEIAQFDAWLARHQKQGEKQASK